MRSCAPIKIPHSFRLSHRVFAPALDMGWGNHADAPKINTTCSQSSISQHLPALFQHLPASPTIPPNSRAIHVGPLSHLIIVFDSVGMSSSLRARTSPNRQLVKGSDVPIQNLGPPTTTHARRDPRQTIAPKNTNWADANQRAPQSNSSLTRLGSGLLGAEDPGPSISSRLQPHMDRLGSALR